MGEIFIAFLISLVYFLPSYVGWDKENERKIFLLNLLLGWTIIGWVIALTWAITYEKRSPANLKKCSFCAEEVQFDAIKCKHCGEMFVQRKFECTISKTSASLLKKGMVNIGLQYSLFESLDQFDKIEIEARDAETLIVELESKNIQTAAIVEIFADGRRSEVYNKCIKCNRLQSTNARIWPCCGNESSFISACATGGAVLGGGLYYLLHLNDPFVNGVWGMFHWLILGGFGGAIVGVSTLYIIIRNWNEIKYKFTNIENSSKLSFIKEVSKKKYKWFIGIATFLVTLSLFIAWRHRFCGVGLAGPIGMVLSLFVLGVLLILLEMDNKWDR